MTQAARGGACAVCGRSAGAAADGMPPAGWMVDSDPRGARRWVCPACVRIHVRAIEARLDPDWW